MNKTYLTNEQSIWVLHKYGLNPENYFLPIYYDADIPTMYLKKRDSIQYINLELEL